jgi:hypothetical protein
MVTLYMHSCSFQEYNISSLVIITKLYNRILEFISVTLYFLPTTPPTYHAPLPTFLTLWGSSTSTKLTSLKSLVFTLSDVRVHYGEGGIKEKRNTM